MPIVLLALVTAPRVCVPGAALALAGVTGNLASLAVWHAVPDPLTVAVAGSRLDFNLADVCIWSGCVAFLLAALWAIWRFPAGSYTASLRAQSARAAASSSTAGASRAAGSSISTSVS